MAAHFHAVLVFQARFQHVKLQYAHHAGDDAFHAEARLAEDLHGAFLRQLVHALDELLAFQRVDLRDSREMLRRERGDGRELHVFALAHRVADAEDAGVEQAHDVAGERLVDGGAVVGHERRARGQLQLLAALHVERLHAALELARADAHERDAVAVILVHVRLDFEHEAREFLALRVDFLAAQGVKVGARRGGQVQELLQERLHAEVRERRAEEHRRQLARQHGVKVELVGGAVEQLDVVHQVAVVFLADQLVKRGVAQFGLDLGNLFRRVAAAFAVEGDDVARLAVEHAAERAAVADGPVHGVRADAEHRLDLFHKLERIAAFAVHLVHEREDGDMAQCAHLEQLLRLGLDALCAVDDHDGGVGGHERAVRVLRKVLVAGGVKDVDAAAVVLELQHGRRDGDAAFLLDVHPVGHGVL